jgi:hypothetical protein
MSTWLATTGTQAEALWQADCPGCGTAYIRDAAAPEHGYEEIEVEYLELAGDCPTHPPRIELDGWNLGPYEPGDAVCVDPDRAAAPEERHPEFSPRTYVPDPRPATVEGERTDGLYLVRLDSDGGRYPGRADLLHRRELGVACAECVETARAFASG